MRSAYGQLGAPRISNIGNLKLDVPAPPADAPTLSKLAGIVVTRAVIAAASTHPGEEDEVIAAHRQLRAKHPKLLTIIAPRHPERGPAIAEAAKVAGLSVGAALAGDLPKPGVDVFVADTLGELGLIYRLAPIVFMGGSLASRGGQNPIEAIRLGAAIVHGPHVWNFAEIYQSLDAAHGAQLVADQDALTDCLGELARQSDRAQSGRRCGGGDDRKARRRARPNPGRARALSDAASARAASDRTVRDPMSVAKIDRQSLVGIRP